MVGAGNGHAEVQDLPRDERLSLARDFVFKMKKGLFRAEQFLDAAAAEGRVENFLEDGEILLLQPVLEPRYRLENVILSRVNNQEVEVSLADFFQSLNLAVDVNVDGQTASGWYLREDRRFDLNIARGTVLTPKGQFNLSEYVRVDDGDMWVPISELAEWTGFDLNVDVSVQEVRVDADVPFPLSAKLARQNFDRRTYKVPDPTLPRADDAYKMSAIPVIDVSTNSTYRRRGDNSEAVDSHSASVRTVGDMANGTLTTNTQWNNTNQLSFARVNYKRESLEPDLLGPLNARSLEIGDITTVAQPFAQVSAHELGVRLSNSDPTKAFNTPVTGISGSAIAGWDVELYRNDQLIAVQEVGEDGVYQFSNVDLYLDDNNFRLIFYGPQGEVREENVYIPVDRGLLSKSNGVYDVSVSLDGKNTYRANSSDDEDEGSIRVSALYEKPLSKGVTAIAGVRSSEVDGTRNTVANIGASTTIDQTLFNTGLAVDDEGDMSANLVVRRDFGEHEFRNSFDWTSANFDNESLGGGIGIASGVATDNFSNSLQVNGPIFRTDDYRLQYSAASDYTFSGEGDYRHLSSLGLNMGARYVNMNGLLRHETGTYLDDDQMDLNLNLSGRIMKNRLRLTADYDIKPESELNSVTASIQRDISEKLDVQLAATKRPQLSVTEYQARLDWQAGFIRISPSIRYNTENDFYAGLNTRFGLVKDPVADKFKMYDENLTHLGMLSAFVYLDKDGDGVFNHEDEPLKDVVVSAPQSGRRLQTDENGVALFRKLRRLRLTDVYVDKDTLQDPSWIPGFDGVSIVPREGYVAEVDFPIHVSGELDGTVYAPVVNAGYSDQQSSSVSLRNITLHLYNDEGQIEMSSTTDVTGFYYFTQIPPGRYLLMIDEQSAQSKNIIRPEPQPIEIGYDGTIIYSNDISVQTGDGDVPSEIMANIDDYKANHPNIDFSSDYDLVLNLGAYNSRLMMSVIWYKLRSRYDAIISGGDLFVSPSESQADTKTGKHVLRVGYKNADIAEGYNKCRALMVREQYCKVEIYPAYMKQAKAEIAIEE